MIATDDRYRRRVARGARASARPGRRVVNDVHSRLNATRVRSVFRPRTTAEVQQVLGHARRSNLAVAICGSRHAMGGQQFAAGALLLDMSGLVKPPVLDREHGRVHAAAGVEWPELIDGIRQQQSADASQWGIAQKQTGADRLTMGGALAANIHGRGLTMRPFISDVESFILIDAEGQRRRCSRSENPELFRLAIGGYGLFGVITTLELRLTPRRMLQRVVEVIRIGSLMDAFERRIADGHMYGDFQFAIDPRSDSFLDLGVFSTYRPVDASEDDSASRKELRPEDWRALLHLAHRHKTAAFEQYAAHYLSTSGEFYWTDTHQLSTYLPGYHRELDAAMGASAPATEVITEVYVPRGELASFISRVRDDFREDETNLIYGTIRLIEEDRESFLPWARQPYACIIFNLCTSHTAEGMKQSAAALRRLIDRVIERGGSYYLTYHRHARPEQVLACHPSMLEFLRRKQEYDPESRFQSSWYRHYRRVFAAEL